jgi:hypothetical protein
VVVHVSLALVSLIEEENMLLTDALQLAPHLSDLLTRISRHFSTRATSKFVSAQHAQQTHSRHLMRMCTLTLLCCSLLATCASRPELLLAVALQCAATHVHACAGLHLRQKLRVLDCAVCAVRAEDGSAHVLLHLCSAERAWSACARLLLQ